MQFKKLQALAESKTQLNEAFRHVRQALVLTPDHLGSTADNPEGHRMLVTALKIFDVKVPETKVYMYDADGFEKEFQRIMKSQKVTHYEWPEATDLKNAGFTLAKTSAGNKFFKKGNLMVVVDTQADGAPPTVLVNGAIDPLKESVIVAEAKAGGALRKKLEKIEKLFFALETEVKSAELSKLLKAAGFPETETAGLFKLLDKVGEEIGDLFNQGASGDLQEAKEPVQNVEATLKKNFKFSKDGDDEMVVVKSGTDFPFRLRTHKDGIELAQAFSPRSYMKPTFKRIAVFKTRDEALARILKRFNDHAKHMAKVQESTSKFTGAVKKAHGGFEGGDLKKLDKYGLTLVDQDRSSGGNLWITVKGPEDAIRAFFADEYDMDPHDSEIDEVFEF